MKIALIGYGRMGHIIEKIARERGHEVVAIIDADNKADFDSDAFRSAQVAIEFSIPTSAAANCRAALEQGVKVVSGTTGWAAQLPEIEELCRALPSTAFMWSSNYSIGVNLFKRIAAFTSRLMATQPQYTASLHEVHHIHKLDHPSGTAITLAETVIANTPTLTAWSEDADAPADNIIITHAREGEVPGIHTLRWESAADSITLTHSAKSREGFALGAVVAAEWLANQKGVRSIDQMIDDIIGKKG